MHAGLTLKGVDHEPRVVGQAVDQLAGRFVNGSRVVERFLLRVFREGVACFFGFGDGRKVGQRDNRVTVPASQYLAKFLEFSWVLRCQHQSSFGMEHGDSSFVCWMEW